MSKRTSPIFVVGSVRSGTTILAHCLGQHPQIGWVSSPEEGPELNRFWTKTTELEMGIPDLGSCCGAAVAATDDRERVQGEFAQLASRLCGPKERYLAKNPHFWNKLPWLLSIFPKARIVVTSRDLYSTVLSTQMLWIRSHHRTGYKHYFPSDPSACWQVVPDSFDASDPTRLFPGGDVKHLAEYWLRVYRALDRDLAEAENSVYFSHRELLENPVSALNGLLENLGLEPYPVERLPEIDGSRNTRWKALLANSERQVVEDFAKQHADEINSLKCCQFPLG